MRIFRREQKIILTALFIALAVVLGYLLAEVPNVELMTVVVFLSGVFLGARLGATVGLLSILFYSLFNPFGPPLLPLMIAQLIGFAVIGSTGGLLKEQLHRTGTGVVITSALAGLVLTLIYDFLTTVATAAIALGLGGFLEGLGGVFLAGSVFIAIHSISNTAVFAVAIVPIVRVMHAWERGGQA